MTTGGMTRHPSHARFRRRGPRNRALGRRAPLQEDPGPAGDSGRPGEPSRAGVFTDVSDHGL